MLLELFAKQSKKGCKNYKEKSQQDPGKYVTRETSLGTFEDMKKQSRKTNRDDSRQRSCLRTQDACDKIGSEKNSREIRLKCTLFTQLPHNGERVSQLKENHVDSPKKRAGRSPASVGRKSAVIVVAIGGGRTRVGAKGAKVVSVSIGINLTALTRHQRGESRRLRDLKKWQCKKPID